MFHYLFTNDLRISNLESFLQEAGKSFVENSVPSAAVDKNANNNMNTLGFYFNLTQDSNCALECSKGNVRAVVLNFIKKFQFPNPRTTESLNQAIEDGITLAPMRTILQVLYLLNMLDAKNAYLSKGEIANYIFFDDTVAKTEKPNIVELAERIIRNRNDGNDIEFPSEQELEQQGCFWKQCKRQLREMTKVLCWSGCVAERDDGTIAIHHDSLTRENEADLFEILTYSDRWIPEKAKNAAENKVSYQKYMDIQKSISNYKPTVFKTGIESELERNRIVFGAPGTGKSYKLKDDAEILLKDGKENFERVTFHPDYSYAQFVGTYKPVMGVGGEIRYEFVPGPFMRVYVDALRSGRTEEPKPYLLLVEEINRAKVAAVFGDIFQLLDRDEDGVSEYEIQTTEDIRKYLAKELGGTPENYVKIQLPDNMFIWATMNSADQGVFPMDTAFKRRWNFEYLGINANEEKIKGRIIIGSEEQQEVEWNVLRKAINEKLAKDYKINEDKLMGPFFLSKKVIKTVSEADDTIVDTKKFMDAFKSKVIMYLYEDAAKQYKHKLFSGCDDTSKYSSVCESFDKIGMKIFGDAFEADFYNQQKG